MDLLYQPLSHGDLEIRLITIFPSNDSSIIHCSLSTVSLSNRPDYKALSYVWGDPANVEDIVVNGQTVTVTRNLATALSAVRDLLSGAPCVLWADALSINQLDSAEKCQQIRLMSMIYKEADWVIGWLGESAEDSDYAMDLLERIGEEMMIDEQASQNNLPTSLDLVGSSVQGEEIPAEGSSGHQDGPSTLEATASDLPLGWLKRIPALTRTDDDSETGMRANRGWRAIQSLLTRPYWKRVWIRQEMVLANKLLLLCGTKGIVWEELRFITKRLLFSDSDFDAAKDYFPPELWYEFHPQNFFSFTFIQVLREAERLGSQLPLFRVVATMDNAKASDPRDYIYGFLGVSRFEIAIDYSRSVEDLYCEFSAGWMEWETLQTASDEPGVSPLMYAGIGFRSQLASLPSWTADLSALGNRRSRWSGHYSPAGKSHIKMAHPTIHGKILRLRGIIVDKIIGIYAWPEGDVMAGIFAIIESLLQDVSELSDGAFLQTLFRLFMYDKRADGLSDLEPGSVYYFEFYAGFLAGLITDAPEVQAKHSDITVFQAIREGIIDEFLRLPSIYEDTALHNGKWLAFAQVLLGRIFIQSFFRTTGGRIGVGVPYTQVGDVVCIVPGRCLPLVLRPYGQHYKLVYTCYVQGLMDGEPVGDDVEEWLSSLEDIEIH